MRLWTHNRKTMTLIQNENSLTMTPSPLFHSDIYSTAGNQLEFPQTKDHRQPPGKINNF